MKVFLKFYFTALLTLVLVYFHTIYTGDIVAMVAGYFFSIGLVPIIVYFILMYSFSAFSYRKINQIKHYKMHFFCGLIMVYIPISIIATLAIISGEM